MAEEKDGTSHSIEEVDLLTGNEPDRPGSRHEIQPGKSDATIQTTELNVASEGQHDPNDLSKESKNLIDIDEAEATTELRTILSQEYPPTPGASSSHSRRQSYSFTKKPTPEPDLPFDFNRFQEQMKAKSADPIAKYLKSFLHEFSKRQWNNTEQHKIIHDFLEFIRGKMLVYEPFKSASVQEFDNAQEGMEKLVTSRLYPDLFPPLIVQKLGKTETQRMGHGEDLDRDRVLTEKIRIYSWLREEHLDISPGSMNDRFLGLAGIEINKLDQYRAPRDKIICILNCCKVIFGLLKNAGGDESADRFMPMLIMTLLRSNTANLCSHISYIQRFRNSDKLFGESGYYLSSLCGAINFIESLDRSSLSIEDDAYDAEVEDAIKRIKLEDSVVPPSPMTPKQRTILPTKDIVFEKATGLLNIAKPSLSSIGRLFSNDDDDGDQLLHQDRMAGQSLSRSYVDSPIHLDRPPLPTRPTLSSSVPTTFIPRPDPQRAELLTTLSAMFENIDSTVIEWILDEKRDNIGASIDALLQIST